MSSGQFHLIWPNIKVNVMPGRANLSVGPLVPNGTDSTDGFLDYFFGPDCDPDWIADYLELDYQVGDEDRVLVESVHRGMRSGAFERGRLMLPSEELIGEFQRWVAGAARSDAVARERQLPRARVDLLVALVGVEALGDDGTRLPSRSSCSACLRGRCQESRASVELQRDSTAAESGSPSDDPVARDARVVHLGARLDEPAAAADVPLEDRLVDAGLGVVALLAARRRGLDHLDGERLRPLGRPEGRRLGLVARGRTGSRRRPSWIVSVTGCGEGQAQGQ